MIRAMLPRPGTWVSRRWRRLRPFCALNIGSDPSWGEGFRALAADNFENRTASEAASAFAQEAGRHDAGITGMITRLWVGRRKGLFYIGGMPADLSEAAILAPVTSRPEPPSLIALFVAFAKMSLAGFGGVLVWARRGIVEDHRWLTAEEFNETFALCHFLPGPNIVNLSVVFGSRFRGIPGSIAAFAGLVLPPVAIVIVLAVLYQRFGEIDALRRILAGISCAAVGLLISVVFRMMTPLIKKRDGVALLVVAGVFTAIGLLRLPLPAVLLVGIPLSLAVTYARRRRPA
jgi:chromate transporter